MPPSTGQIKTGVCSWTDESLLDSGWYPDAVHTAEDRLRYYATQFSLVENDSTYYAVPEARQAERWAQRTPVGFTMNVKAFASLTDHYTDPRRLPATVRMALPTEIRERARVYPKDLGPEILEELAVRFRAGIEPLRTAGRLGVVLFQYPVWVPWSRENERRILATRDVVPGARVAVEFRNATWMDHGHVARTLALLCDAGLSYTCVDEPQGFVSSVPPVAFATSDLAVVRFHGRAAERWARSASTARERFHYLYSEEELRGWAPKVRALAEQAETVHVLMNNCFSDYAVVNAQQMKALLRAPLHEGRGPSGEASSVSTPPPRARTRTRHVS